MDVFYDYYSALPIAYVFHAILANPFDVNLIVGLFITEVVVRTLKGQSNRLTKESWWHNITRRPILSNKPSRCDLLSRREYAVGTPGFPSGHMALTTFFFCYLLTKTHGNLQLAWMKDKQMCMLYTVLTSFMGFVRWKKQCHTWIQIFAGMIVGVSIHYLFQVFLSNNY